MTPQQLQQCIARLCPTATYPKSYTIVTDASGNATIGLWDNSVGTQPTADQLNATLTGMELTTVQAAQIATLETAYNAARYGATVTVASGSSTLTFPTDTATQMNISGYLTALAAGAALGSAVTLPATVPLQDASGAVQMLTLAQLQQLAVAIMNQSAAAWTKLQGLMAQVNAATTVSAVQALVWSAA